MAVARSIHLAFCLTITTEPLQ